MQRCKPLRDAFFIRRLLFFSFTGTGVPDVLAGRTDVTLKVVSEILVTILNFYKLRTELICPCPVDNCCVTLSGIWNICLVVNALLSLGSAHCGNEVLVVVYKCEGNLLPGLC